MALVRSLVEQYLPVRYDRLHRPLEKRLSPAARKAVFDGAYSFGKISNVHPVITNNYGDGHVVLTINGILGEFKTNDYDPTSAVDDALLIPNVESVADELQDPDVMARVQRVERWATGIKVAAVAAGMLIARQALQE